MWLCYGPLLTRYGGGDASHHRLLLPDLCLTLSSATCAVVAPVSLFSNQNINLG